MKMKFVTIKLLTLFLAVTGCSNPEAYTDDPSTALVGWWKFDEGAGATAADSSGFGNTATIRNGGWGGAQNSAALAMDGGDDGIVVVPLSDSLRSTADAITVMGWTYRTARHNVAIIAHEYPALFFGFHGRQFKWEFLHEDGQGVSCYPDGNRHTAVLDQWIHVAATYDGRRGRLYADGVEICSDSYRGSIRMPESPFTISGYLRDGNENDLVDEITGMLADVRIYNRALTEEQIRAVHAAGLP